MSKFNTVSKVSRPRKDLVKTIKKPKFSTELANCQLERNLEGNQAVFRESKYHKKIQSNIRRTINEDVKK